MRRVSRPCVSGTWAEGHNGHMVPRSQPRPTMKGKSLWMSTCFSSLSSLSSPPPSSGCSVGGGLPGVLGPAGERGLPSTLVAMPRWSMLAREPDCAQDGASAESRFSRRDEARPPFVSLGDARARRRGSRRRNILKGRREACKAPKLALRASYVRSRIYPAQYGIVRGVNLA